MRSKGSATIVLKIRSGLLIGAVLGDFEWQNRAVLGSRPPCRRNGRATGLMSRSPRRAAVCVSLSCSLLTTGFSCSSHSNVTGESPSKSNAERSSSPTSEPIAVSLGPPPACGGNTPTLIPSFGSGIGGSGVWALSFGGSEATAHIGNARRTSHGWTLKVLFIAMKTLPLDVHVVGRSISQGSSLWFESVTGRTAPKLTLGLHTIPPTKGWRQYPSHVFIPAAGCYELKASWPTGSWTAVFSAGK
jgi:hypothetical protein